MQYFRDTATDQIYAYDDDVTVTLTGSVSTVTAKIPVQNEDDTGKLVTSFVDTEIAAPTTLQPCAEPVPPAPPAPTPADLARTALASGLAITSTGTPALDGVYACDPEAQAKLMATDLYITKRGTFYGGVSTYPWVDMEGNPHIFTMAEFDNLATAIANYVAALDLVIAGQSETLPAATATIA